MKICRLASRSVAVVFAVAGLALNVSSPIATAQTAITNTRITFNEYPFPTNDPTRILTGTVSGDDRPRVISNNLLNDSTGEKLLADNGDQRDFDFAFSVSGADPDNRVEGLNWDWEQANAGQLTGINRFHGVERTVNNPGNRIVTGMAIRFASHLSVTEATARFRGLNSASTGWEFSLISFLRVDGSLWDLPVIPKYNEWNGTSGPVGRWFVAGDKRTVEGVGTNTSRSGEDGPNDTYTLNYTDIDLAPGTQVGGIVMLHVFEDVRGRTNGAVEARASITDFTIVSGSIIPAPGAAGLLAMAGALAMARGRRRA
jgi:hypothetical protein